MSALERETDKKLGLLIGKKDSFKRLVILVTVAFSAGFIVSGIIAGAI